MNAVTPGAAPDDHHAISRVGRLADLVARNQPQAATIHEWVTQVARVMVNGSVDRRDSHPVAVVRDSLHDAA